jgi:hypothetical protein
MSWTLNSIKMYIQDYGGNNVNTIARIQPLVGGTILQHFGYEDEILRLSGIIVGTSDRDALKGLSKVQTAYALVHADGSSLGNYYVKSFIWKQMSSVCQTIRGDLPSTAPLFQIEMELYE